MGANLPFRGKDGVTRITDSIITSTYGHDGSTKDDHFLKC